MEAHIETYGSAIWLHLLPEGQLSRQNVNAKRMITVHHTDVSHNRVMTYILKYMNMNAKADEVRAVTDQSS